MNKRLRLAGIGCGGRTRTYLEIAASLPQFYEIVAVADPVESRRTMIREKSGNPDFLEFHSDLEILAGAKLADVMIIGTQDGYHVGPCLAAMEKGYDILLEKPIATNLRDVLALERRAVELGRKVLVCHVLRYSPFYTKVKELIVSGVLGDIVTINASEGVDPWHQAHSFVRGHWAVTEKATPMIVAKSCHDLDLISWLMDRKCLTISSYGSLSHFTAAHAPEGAPARCNDGCPAAAACPYNAFRYLGDHRGWLQWIYDRSATATDAEVTAWLAESPWGRCVYHCDNTAVDHQVVAMAFEGGATATFTMTAFDSGRNLEIMGTKGVLRGGHVMLQNTGCDILVEEFAAGNKSRHTVNSAAGGYSGHGGGDPGLVHALYNEMSKSDPALMRSSITRSVESHLMGFAAEESRLSEKTVHLAEFRRRHS